jgi:hypothetical protein
MHFFQILSKIKQSYYFSSRQGAYQIWPTGSIFCCAHGSMMYLYVFIGVIVCVFMSV